MKSEEEIEAEIKEIENNRAGLMRQGREEEAKEWNSVLYHLRWVLGKYN